MITRTRLSVVGMVAIAAASFLYMQGLGLQIGKFDHERAANMFVPDTNGLVVGSKVLLRGVPIGEVSKIVSSAEHIEIAWKYDSDYDIPIDSRFRVDNLSALGETYLAVLPATASGPYLDDNAVIDESRVMVPTTFKELSERLTRMLEQVDPDRIQDIFHAIDVALPDDTRVLGDLSHAGEILAATITHQSGNLTTLLNSVQSLLLNSASVPGDLADTAPGLARFGREFTNMLNGLHFATEFAPFPEGLRDGASPFIDNVQGFLDKTAHDLNTLGVDLLPAVRSGAAAMQTVDSGRLLDNALAATASGDSVAVHIHPPGR